MRAEISASQANVAMITVCPHRDTQIVHAPQRAIQWKATQVRGLRTCRCRQAKKTVVKMLVLRTAVISPL